MKTELAIIQSEFMQYLREQGLAELTKTFYHSVGHRLFGSSWQGLEVPRHLAIFSRNGMVRAVDQLGFTMIAETAWNLRDIRRMFARSEAIAAGEDPSNCRASFIPNPRLLLGLALEAFFHRHREFVCIRATKK